MAFVIKRLLLKLAEKGVTIDMADVMNQMNASDVITLLKGLL